MSAIGTLMLQTVRIVSTNVVHGMAQSRSRDVRIEERIPSSRTPYARTSTIMVGQPRPPDGLQGCVAAVHGAIRPRSVF
ncbi:MAG: hypothetical protein WAN99_10515 [Methanoculleus sp.]